MTIETDQVRKFYEKIWNSKSTETIPDVLHEDILFRGSLGQECKGHAAFKEYLEMIHDALSDYKCEIEDMVSESNKVFTKMTFSGVHTGEFMGYKPSAKKVFWSGAALFTFSADKIVEIWVLGDLTSLQEQLRSYEK